MKKIFTAFFAGILSFSVFAEEIPGQQFLSYFAANCKTQGEWTRAALDDSFALIETLRGIQNDPDCKSVGGAISQLGLLSQQLTLLDKTNSTKSQIASLDSQEQELLLQLSKPGIDPVVVEAIQVSLSTVQQQRAGILGSEKTENDLAGADKLQTLTSVVQIANTAFSQVTANQTCLQNHPNVLNAATTMMATVGATAAYVNPALGIGLTAGAMFIGTTVEGVKNHYTARQIKRISDTSVAMEGYRCALETMSDKWCEMKDAESFLEFKARQRQTSILDGNLASAIRLNDREIPVLLDWLNKIRSGVTPTTTADADRQNAVFQRETYVRAFEANGLAKISETNQQLDGTEDGDVKTKKDLIKALVNSIVPKPDQYFRNPLLEIHASGYAPFYLLGLKEDDSSIRNDVTKNFYSLDEWPGYAKFNPDMGVIKNNFDLWVAEAEKKVNKELTQVLQPDALQTLTTAYDRSGNRWKISAMDAMKKLIEFLQKNPPKDEDIAFRKLFKSTLDKLAQMYSLTETAVIKNDGNLYDGDVTIVEKIYELAQLRNGTVVLEARLDLIVRVSLLRYLQSSPQEDQILIAQLLATDKFTETLSKISGTDNLEMIRVDIQNGEGITYSNLNSFLDVFGKNISRILQTLKLQEQNASRTEIQTKRNLRTHLCFLLLSVPDVSEYIDENLCLGLKMTGLTKDSPESITITPGTFKKDMSERACEYSDFFERSQIYNTWGIKM